MDTKKLFGRFRNLKVEAPKNDWVNAGIRDELDFDRFRLVSMLALSQDCAYIDIGGHKGRYVNEARRYSFVEIEKIWVFEANPALANHLREHFPNVVETALSDFTGKTKFYVCNYDGLSGLQARSEGYPEGSTFQEIEVSVNKLDDYNFETRVGLIKIDVEGAELQVVIGAFNTIMEHRPVIFIEHGPTDSRFLEIDQSIELYTRVRGMNYSIVTVDGEIILDLDSWVDFYKNRPIWNYVLVPRPEMSKNQDLNSHHEMSRDL